MLTNIEWLGDYESFLNPYEANVLEHNIMADFEMFGLKKYYYSPKRNVFKDRDGNIVIDIFRFISPGILFLFKQQKETILARDIEGHLIKICYPPTSCSNISNFKTRRK